jgi:hypothetical protein
MIEITERMLLNQEVRGQSPRDLATTARCGVSLDCARPLPRSKGRARGQPQICPLAQTSSDLSELPTTGGNIQIGHPPRTGRTPYTSVRVQTYLFLVKLIRSLLADSRTILRSTESSRQNPHATDSCTSRSAASDHSVSQNSATLTRTDRAGAYPSFPSGECV